LTIAFYLTISENGKIMRLEPRQAPQFSAFERHAELAAGEHCPEFIKTIQI